MLGCTVDIVEGGRKARLAEDEPRYDLVLMEIPMPEMDSLAATQMIRKGMQGIRDLPVIALTANAADAAGQFGGGYERISESTPDA
ncbi:MAG: response regulator [Gammaproteobacteria bacterium]|nr:response regulator [Gammaproteobacteria bacterium]